MEQSRDKIMPPDLPFEGAIVVGSLALVAYADKYGLKLPSNIVVGDTDLCVRPSVFKTLQELGWHKNTYCGVTTLRDKPDGAHRYDVGTGAFVWTYDEIIDREYTIEHNRITYLDPLRTLKWYLALNRKKDQSRIRFLEEQVLPVWLATQPQDRQKDLLQMAHDLVQQPNSSLPNVEYEEKTSLFEAIVKHDVAAESPKSEQIDV